MRHPRILMAALAFIATGFALTAPPAVAAVKPEVVVKEGTAVTKTYPALLGQGQATEDSNHPSPAECSTPPGDQYCDVIPVRVILPKDYDENSDEFVTRVTLSWPESASSSDDMDLFIYNARGARTGQSSQGAVDTGDPTNNPKPDPNPEISASADAKFSVIALNSAGPNQGYTLKFVFTRKRFTPVTERPSSFGAGNSGGSSTPSAPAARPTQSPSSPASPSFGGPIAAALDLPPLDLTDPDFAAGANSDLTSGLFSGRSTLVKTTPAKPVSAGILIAMLGVLPLGAVGAGGVFFRRRASRLLQF